LLTPFGIKLYFNEWVLVFLPTHFTNLKACMTLEILNLFKSYDKNFVLNDVSLKFLENEIYCIIGKNGTGKSTIINIISGLITQDSGFVKYDNQSYSDLPKEIKEKIGVLNEESSLIDELTPFQFLNLNGFFFNLNSEKIQTLIDKFFNYFFSHDEIQSFKSKRISDLSTGTKKKIEIIAASFHLPDFLILDEPFSGLDPLASNILIDYFNQYLTLNRTIVFTSHNIDFIEKINPNIIILNDNKIKFVGKIIDFNETRNNDFSESILKEFDFKKKFENFN
jgi:ABC-type multidrug transport system ATPase subunit